MLRNVVTPYIAIGVGSKLKMEGGGARLIIRHVDKQKKNKPKPHPTPPPGSETYESAFFEHCAMI